MVCSKVDSSDQIKSMDGEVDENASSRAIEILTPEGKTLKMNIGENTMIKSIKIDCELLCGIPSDLQLIKLQGKDLCNDDTISRLEITDGCTLRVAIPQWWQKFVSTCYKGDTQQVRKRIYVKMSQVSREERSFTAAFIGAVKGNHNLMFAAFAGRNMNLHSKTKLSGRNLLHAAVSGGSTSCVANILMNGGNALLEAPDNTCETPVKMAKKLYGDAGDIVKFLNVYLELHRRETRNSSTSNRYWDNLERNNNSSDVVSGDNDSNNGDESRSQSDEHISTQFADLNLDAEERQGENTRINDTETEFFNNNSAKSFPSVTKVNIEDYDAGQNSENSFAVRLDDSSKPNEQQQINENTNNVSSNEQGCVQKSDTGYYSSNNQSNGKDAQHVTEMLWNEELFAQTQTPQRETTTNKERNLACDRPAEDDTNMSLLSADPSADRDDDSSQWPKPPTRRAQQRKQVFIEQRRKRSTTERPNLELLLAMNSGDNSCPLRGESSEGLVNEPRDSSEGLTNESRDKEQTSGLTNESRDGGLTNESREKQSSAITTGEVLNVSKDQVTLPTATSSSSHDTDVSHSPKPLRRAQLRKKSIVEQRRRRSIAARPNLEELEANREERTEEAAAIESKEVSTAVESKEEAMIPVESKEKGLAALESKDVKITAIESRKTESTAMDRNEEEESPFSARYVLQLWQDQAQESSAAAALSGDESDTGHSPKIPRRALLRKQVFMEQRRKRSATERPNLIKLIAARKEDDDEIPGQDDTKITLQGKPEVKPPPEDENDAFVVPISQESVNSEFSPVTPSNDVSMKVHFSEDKETAEPPLHSPITSQTQERTPIRPSQRSSHTGPLLEARAKKGARSHRTSLSGDESDVSDNEQTVTKETVAPILAKTPSRRRLPLLPNKTIKLPLIKIEDSGTFTGSDTRDIHVAKSRDHVHASGIRDNFKAPHPPLGRSRSGSMCSEDSVSSGEMLYERIR